MTPHEQIKQRLDEMQAKADAATKGPWFVRDFNGLHINTKADGGHVCQVWGDVKMEIGTGAFIAAARTDVPVLLSALLEAVEALEEIGDSHDAPQNDYTAREALSSILTKLTP